MGAFLEADEDFLVGESNLSGGANEVAEDVPRLGLSVAVADLDAEKPIEAA